MYSDVSDNDRITYCKELKELKVPSSSLNVDEIKVNSYGKSLDKKNKTKTTHYS